MIVYLVVEDDVYSLPLGVFDTLSSASNYLKYLQSRNVPALIERVTI